MHPDRSPAGPRSEPDRARANDRIRDWKACWGQPLASSNLASSAVAGREPPREPHTGRRGVSLSVSVPVAVDSPNSRCRPYAPGDVTLHRFGDVLYPLSNSAAHGTIGVSVGDGATDGNGQKAATLNDAPNGTPNFLVTTRTVSGLPVCRSTVAYPEPALVA
jgi:hypothetical protein